MPVKQELILSGTPQAERPHIVFIGKRNSGKSSLINAVAGQQLSIVSEIPGTTTDPVKKAMELQPAGPVIIVDTAGYDDDSVLGSKRIDKTKKAISGADFCVIIVDSSEGIHAIDNEYIGLLQELHIPFLVVFNKSDLVQNLPPEFNNAQFHTIATSIYSNDSIVNLKNTIASLLPTEAPAPLVSDLVRQGDIIILVVPIDLGAPKGRLIMPQVQTIRESLDSDCIVMVVKDKELRNALASLSRPPALVVTDSQAVMRVTADVPPEIPITTFSILMARYKGDLRIFLNAVNVINKLENGDKVLIAEACTHHAKEDDIGSIKIPRWLRLYTKKNLEFGFCRGADFPDDVSAYKLIVHCGGCTLTRKALLSRLKLAGSVGVPIINYGVLISLMHGSLPRAIEPFPEAVKAWQEMVDGVL